jgi:hypothetical protein
MNEKKTLESLLRSEEVYRDPDFQEPGDGWRSALLDEYEKPPMGVLPSPRRETERSPLQWHHLGQMTPAAIGLFLAGWMAGSGDQLPQRLASIDPFAYMGIAMVVGLSTVVWWRRQST